MEDHWLSQAKRLQALAATGLHYTRDDFDRERYEEIDAIAKGLIARLGDVPIARLAGLPARDQGYATPKIDVRAAVFRAGRVLMVRERTDGRWTLPGGFADIGHSAAENAVKETWEEAGLQVRAQKLSHVRHRAKRADDPDYLDFYKFFFLCETLDAAEPAAGPEVFEARFVDPGDLPELSQGRTRAEDVAEALAHLGDPGRLTQFD